jgi:CheY-like chemotaxis protein
LERKPTILAVDDTPGNLVALEAVLDQDFELRFARSGFEAITMLRDRPDVDVILMDVNMPGMDGYAAASEIKKLPGCADIPIVFITAVYNQDPHVKRGYEVGGVDYFTKPFDPTLLKLKIGIYASFRHREREREKQRAETDELLRAERTLFELLKTLPPGVLVVDGNGRVREANKEVSCVLKVGDRVDHARLAAILGWWDSSEGVVDERAPLLAAALRGDASNDDLVITCGDGTMRTVHVCASPLHGADGAIVGAVVVMQDISEPVRVEAELAHQIAHLVPATRHVRSV